MKRTLSLVALFLLMFALAVPAAAQEPEKKEEAKKEEAKADDGLPPPPERPKSLEEAVKKADIIFIGAVDFVGDKPGSWGRPPYRPSSQFIRYDVLKFLKGHYDVKKITVIHELAQGAKLVSEPPALNPTIFDIDRKVIVLVTMPPLHRDPVTFHTQDPNFSAAAWSEETEKQIAGMAGK